MKQRDLIRIIQENGAVFVRHGADHDWKAGVHTPSFRLNLIHVWRRITPNTE